ncbi:hypothetical protein BO99DRAFT_435912 [Aspergillus violaceofuscus CBS 115571]|uniref:Uncharacterized protein n=1 Tax=Aspergillus violaceofuscus (strain CBS 115571) TaxID=1450538 RepID=A0A2V5HIV0_ASPV1|nr:hypothetical protein BO99DRAFT_435912 [Aspergillus violaceofuscus CBS 115571]
MFAGAKAVFRRYPNSKAGAIMAVFEFLAAQGVRLGPITLETQFEDYFIEGSRRAYEVRTTYLVSKELINRVESLLKDGKKSPLKTTSEGKLVWKRWLEFKFRRVVAEYKSKIACKPQEPATVTFRIWGKVTGIYQTYRHGMLTVILCVTCGLLYYLVQLLLAYPPPKSDWQKFLDGCKALIGW